MTREISVAEAKKRFSELLAHAAQRGDRFIIEQGGKPLAALVGLQDLSQIEEEQSNTFPSQGLLAAAQALNEYEDFEEVMSEIHRSRQKSKSRSVKLN